MSPRLACVTGIQGSLLDLADEVTVHPLCGVQRTPLAHGAWVDVMTGFVGGAHELSICTDNGDGQNSYLYTYQVQ